MPLHTLAARADSSGGRADRRRNRREAVDAGPVVLLHVALDPVRAARAQALALGGVHVRALARVVHERHAVAAGAGDPRHLDDHDAAPRRGYRRLVEGGLGEQGAVALVTGERNLAAPVQPYDARLPL